MASYYSDNKDIKFHLSHPLMKRIVALKERNFAEKDQYEYAPLDYEDAFDSYDKVLEVIGEICAEIIAPNAESVDKEGPTIVNNEVHYARGTQENHEALVKAGVVGICLPRKYNGLNFPILPYVMAGEMISRSDAGFANIYGLQDCAETLYEFASEEIKQEFLPRFNLGETAAMDLTEPDAGSDLQAVQLKAHFDKDKNMWVLNGVKRFITNGDAHISLVLARSEEGTSDGRGLSLFVYDRVNKAVTVRRIENKLGIKGSPTCELVFKDAPAKLVGDRKLGLIKYVMSLMNSARLGVAGQSVGIAEAAYREGLKYANERAQFGKAIIQFPAVYEMLHNMNAKTKAIRSLLYETARYVDMYKILQEISEERALTKEEKEEQKEYRKLADAYTPMIKMMASEYCNQIAYDSLQIHGGTGFMKDFPIERIYRDARITTIYEGTSQLQVVAAIKAVTTGFYSLQAQRMSSMINVPELDHLKRKLNEMAEVYANTVKIVTDVKENEYIEFHARRMVEMASNITMGCLLLLDSQRDMYYKECAEIFIRKGYAENKQHAEYISNFELKDLAIYKTQLEAV